MPSTNYKTFEQILNTYEFNKKICIKYVFSKSARYEGLLRLKMMNINAATLLPGLEGFCRSLSFQILSRIQTLKRLF